MLGCQCLVMCSQSHAVLIVTGCWCYLNWFMFLVKRHTEDKKCKQNINVKIYMRCLGCLKTEKVVIARIVFVFLVVKQLFQWLVLFTIQVVLKETTETEANFTRSSCTRKMDDIVFIYFFSFICFKH